MNKVDQKYFDFIQFILLEYQEAKPCKLWNTLRQAKVDNYTLQAAERAGLIRIHRVTRQKNSLKAKIKAEELQPIHINNVFRELKAIYQEMKERKVIVEKEKKVEKTADKILQGTISKKINEMIDREAEKLPRQDDILQMVNRLRSYGFKVTLETI